MNCHSKKFIFHKTKSRGFSLVELSAAVVILGFICTSVLVIINNSMEKGSDLVWRTKAFEIARENMERLLARDSLTNETDQGIDSTYPGITWETKVDSIMQGDYMWVEAISTASYIDSAGEEQTVELSHWLTSLSKKMMVQIMEQQQKELAWLRNQRDYDEEFPDATPSPTPKPEDDPYYCPECDENAMGLGAYIQCLEEKCGIKVF